jgi:hypothetical protein
LLWWKEKARISEEALQKTRRSKGGLLAVGLLVLSLSLVNVCLTWQYVADAPIRALREKVRLQLEIARYMQDPTHHPELKR